VFKHLLSRTYPPANLLRLYDAAACRWQQGIERLGYPAAYSQFMNSAVPSVRGGVVLDAGSGTGAFAAAWAGRTGGAERLDLLDISRPMLDEARRRLAGAADEVNSIHAAIGDPSLPAAAYDTVLSAHVIEHTPDPAASIAWLATLLRPGGLLLLAVSRPHWCTTLIRLRWGNASLRSEVVVSLLLRAGFTDVVVAPFMSGPPQRTSCGYVATRAWTPQRVGLPTD
jgi:2-polyprenyl-3-methyl-5-hydroxy-6-metoxy-1,4-benzoquinol methylase